MDPGALDFVTKPIIPLGAVEELMPALYMRRARLLWCHERCAKRRERHRPIWESEQRRSRQRLVIPENHVAARLMERRRIHAALVAEDLRVD